MIVNRETTAIVVDSTADLPSYLANDPNISMVPLTVYFGEDAYLDWVDIQPEEFYRKLEASPVLPRTSQPSPGAFIERYSKLREKYERVYSIHLSSKLSGTWASAEVARGEVEGVEVVDSRLATCGIGLFVDRLLALMDKGTPESEFKAYIDWFVQHAMLLFLPLSLDQLYKGGRIGRASHLMGGLLNVKPVLSIVDGVVDVHQKVRGQRQALEVMRDGVLKHTEAGRTVYIGLSHSLNKSLTAQLRELLEEVTDRKIEVRLTSLIGSVIGTYTGQGTVGMGVIQE